MNASPAPLIVLTGERGVGKSTVCSTLRHLALTRRARCGGFLTRRDFDDSGATVGLTLEAAADGLCHRLAAAHADLGGPRIGPFSMDKAILDWGTQLARSAFAAQVDLVFLDEIGPLELEQGLGFAPAIPLIAAHPRTAVLLVVRPALVEVAARQIARRIDRIEIVSRENRDVLAGGLDKELFAAPPCQDRAP
jgi:nucleoside-triphosphatase THEP1